jgi:MazG family protein
MFLLAFAVVALATTIVIAAALRMYTENNALFLGTESWQQWLDGHLGHFAFADVAGAIGDKMVSRHPHVFGDQHAATPEDVKLTWEAQKEAERRAKAGNGASLSALDGVTAALPALLRAEKLQKRAARVRFDWPHVDHVFDKLDEELGEIREEIEKDGGHDRLEDEVGDLLFVVANLARHLKVDPEAALRRANAKFERRFRAMEAALEVLGEKAEDQTLETLEELWQAAKQAERAG